ncbi:MAG: two pore domain potassium channel family protein [Gammaproteobacteria bacterium]|nr:two pore domain potassium channel family protein [Gammaproteobacteria bacterium]
MKRKPSLTTKLRFRHFVRDVLTHTPFLKMIVLLIVLWLAFSAAVYWADGDAPGTTLTSYDRALYWSVAAFTTAGIADAPVSGLARLIGGAWIIIGSVLFFGTVVATITGYFLRPLQRPARQIIDTIEYNLERLGDLSIEELDLLKETTDALILHMERHKARSSGRR